MDPHASDPAVVKYNGPKHTPGPWRVDAEGFSTQIMGEHSVCSDVGSPADARLIAAAPDMLEALKTVIESVSDEDCNWWPCFDAARAAIAKAVGDRESDPASTERA